MGAHPLRHIEQLSENKFRVRIIRKHQLHTVGIYPTPEEAITARDEFLKELDGLNIEAEGWSGRGVTAVSEVPDEEAVYKRVVKNSRDRALLEARKQSQLIKFDEAIFGLVFPADQHIGADGVDYQTLFDDAQIIAETPGMFAFLVGDLLEQIILPKMMFIRHRMRIVIPEEAALGKRYVRLLAPKIVGAVSGNHDLWLQQMASWDYFSDALRTLSPCAIYDRYKVNVRLQAGKSAWRLQARHKWRGYSIYNPFHGQIRAAWQGANFDVSVGAHIHSGGLYGQFAHGGRTRHMVLANTYKRYDDYKDQCGFPDDNNVPCVGLLFNGENRTIKPYADLEVLAGDLRKLHRAGA